MVATLSRKEQVIYRSALIHVHTDADHRFEVRSTLRLSPGDIAVMQAQMGYPIGAYGEPRNVRQWRVGGVEVCAWECSG